MNQNDLNKTKTGKRDLTREVATRDTDPKFYGTLNFLPNPDPILRKLGKTQEVFDAVKMDAHVVGELRAVRSGLLSYEYRLQPGGEDPASMRAFDLCEAYMAERPAPGMSWRDVIWNKAQAVFRGFAVHEVVWQRFGNELMPAKIMDRPQRRFVFDNNNELRLLTRKQLLIGEELGPRKWLVTRHMPECDNPYGIALFSSCFWPYTFKHGGFKFFHKFCEKYGLPWAVGKYPRGTSNDDINAFAESLQAMVEDAVAAIPDDGTVELLTSSSSGQLPQERLIDLCNREMSKALTSQTLATEIQGNGSRAASETHRDREEGVSESDRETISDTFNELFQWITDLNVPNALPPTFEFYEEAEARESWVSVLDKARAFMHVPVEFAHSVTQIPQPEDGEETLPQTGTQPAHPIGETANFSRCPGCGEIHDFKSAAETEIDKLTDKAAKAADKVIEENIINVVSDLLAEFERDGKTLEDFQTELVRLFPRMNDQRLGELTTLALMQSYTNGFEDAK